jgi:NAD(P)-dependent dehydrogenase (short-subunit alcohol dehydrogenase family)
MKKKVLITGSTQGIGKALAAAFVREGYDVIVHGSSSMKKADGVREEIGAWKAVTADLSKIEEIKSLRQKTGDVDILILNASVQFKESWDNIGEENFDMQVMVNIKSTLMLIQDYYPAMKEKGWGRIVTIGSTNQYRNHPELPMYAATKCAVMSLVKNIAKQAAPFGVTVNNIAPGAIATPRNAAIYEEDAKRKAVEDSIPMGHFGQPKDCVGAVLLLCSDAGAYITGSDLVMDGGLRL